RLHRVYEANFIEHLLEQRQPIGNPQPSPRFLMKGINRAEQLRHSTQKRKSLSFQELAQTILAIEFGQFRLVLEKFELARSARHVQIDNSFGFGLDLRRTRRQRTSAVAAFGPIDSGICLQGNPKASQTSSAALQEMPTRNVFERVASRRL